ncbi:uncharacterized protein LOC134768920 [Penaeus indicus]|uniref:uncharacterized protein LOC134768920 n=1 Tax=Penaeus indicus TaxID=29960 RepID=UPI00300C3297
MNAESPNRSAKLPTNPSNPPASPDEPSVKPENLPTNPSEAPTNLKESRTPSRIPNQLRTLFSRVGRGSSRACQVRQGNVRQTETQKQRYWGTREKVILSLELLADSPSMHTNNPASHTDNLFSHPNNPPSHANHPSSDTNPPSHANSHFSGTNNPFSYTNPPSHANSFSSDTNRPSSHANNHFQHLSNPRFSDPSSRSTPKEFDDDSRESPVDSHSEEKFEPRDRESTSGRRPHGSYTPSNEHKGTIQDSRNGNGAGDTMRLTYDSLSPSNHDHRAYRFHTESDVTGLPPHGKAATDNHFPYDLQLGYNMYTINTGGGPPTDARVLVSHSELQSSVKPNTRDVENNHEYRANERAQIPADLIGYKTQVLTGDQGRYETQGDNNQKVSGVQGKYQLGEITGPNQPMYGYRWVSDDRTEVNDGEAYYVSIAEQGAREQAEPDPVIAQRNRRQRNHETLYPFLILHHGQEL